MANIPWKTQEEIDAEKNAPPQPTEAEQRIEDLEVAISYILGGAL